MQGRIHSALHTVPVQVSHRYGIFTWWWAHSCPKNVVKSNKHIKKIYAPSWFYLQDLDSCLVWVFTTGYVSKFTSNCIINKPTNMLSYGWLCHMQNTDFLESNMGKLHLTAMCIHTVLTEPAQIKTNKIHIPNKDQWSIILDITTYMSYTGVLLSP